LSRAKWARQIPMEFENCCVECSLLIDAPVAFAPHDSLSLVTTRLAGGQAEYYACRTCRAKLLRDHKRLEPGKRWRLV
jgi:hypothetical protein